MLGEIDRHKKPVKPQLFLAKPNRIIISKLSEAFNIILNVKLTHVNDMTFDLPYNVDINHNLVRNKNIDLLKENFYE